ncbi:hypothetical protein BDV33DRAFT_229495 [Aspergillus novoparasiticus]|uniref:Cell surface protein Mas1 n=1 Tax=Aspergillus novoparasiticus TaxID=986946 RepID=A0A5N6E9I1_9EURO|nr:hypothetical protein BDV33DRAFT_229495 [Aspergillus novoparasiticus]
MRLIATLSAMAFAMSQASAHGLITSVHGANGVNMPGLTVLDGTPRGCPSAACGAQKDTAIIRDGEFESKMATPLGRTLGGGPVDPGRVISSFMRDPVSSRPLSAKRQEKGSVPAVNNAASVFTNAGGVILNGAQDLVDATPFGGGLKSAQSAVDGLASLSIGTTPGSTTDSQARENGIQSTLGYGAAHGLPTPDGRGVLRMTYHVVNQDGGGPLTADVDYTSGGKLPQAFKSVMITKNIPGVEGFSTSSTMDYELQVQVGTEKCRGSVGRARNVCIIRVRNSAIAGPFGGSGAFTN